MTDTRHTDDPVTVFESADPALLLVAKSLLEEADVEYYAKGEGTQDLLGAGRLGTGFNPVVGVVQLQVAADDAQAARDALRDLGA